LIAFQVVPVVSAEDSVFVLKPECACATCTVPNNKAKDEQSVNTLKVLFMLFPSQIEIFLINESKFILGINLGNKYQSLSEVLQYICHLFCIH
jgi:hypothetical protein